MHSNGISGCAFVELVFCCWGWLQRNTKSPYPPKCSASRICRLILSRHGCVTPWGVQFWPASPASLLHPQPHQNNISNTSILCMTVLENSGKEGQMKLKGKGGGHEGEVERTRSGHKGELKDNEGNCRGNEGDMKRTCKGK